MIQVQNFIEEQHMIERGDKVIAGVSGGADSLCLLFELLEFQKKCPFELEVVHVEHGIRGEASLQDAAFVEELCGKLEIPFHLFHFDIQKMAEEQKLTVEEAGRSARYRAFEEAAGREKTYKIAVAHNLEDQAETVLMHLVRGSGLKGLGGIRPVRGQIIRPLLHTKRSEIEAELNRKQICWRVDETNLQDAYTRNRIRLEILPMLSEKIHAKAAEHIAEAALHMQAAEDYLQSQTAKLAESYVTCKNGKVFLLREGFLQQETLMQEYLIRFCLEKMQAGLKDIAQVHIRDLCRLAARENGKMLDLPMRLKAKNKNEFLVFEKKQKEWKDTENDRVYAEQQLEIPGEICWGEYRIRTQILPYQKQIIPEKKYTKWFDYDTIKHMLKIRTRQSGDYLSVHAGGGKKSLKKYMIDEKILQEERAGIPLIAEESHILWVVGYRISEAYKVTEATARILQIQIDKEKENGR